MKEFAYFLNRMRQGWSGRMRVSTPCPFTFKAAGQKESGTSSWVDTVMRLGIIRICSGTRQDRSPRPILPVFQIVRSRTV